MYNIYTIFLFMNTFPLQEAVYLDIKWGQPNSKITDFRLIKTGRKTLNQ